MTIDDYVAYFSTYSGHMTYVKKHKNELGFVDPGVILKSDLEKDIEIFKQNGVEIDKKPIIMTNRFYIYQMYNH